MWYSEISRPYELIRTTEGNKNNTCGHKACFTFFFPFFFPFLFSPFLLYDIEGTTMDHTA